MLVWWSLLVVLWLGRWVFGGVLLVFGFAGRKRLVGVVPSLSIVPCLSIVLGIGKEPGTGGTYTHGALLMVVHGRNRLLGSCN